MRANSIATSDYITLPPLDCLPIYHVAINYYFMNYYSLSFVFRLLSEGFGAKSLTLISGSYPINKTFNNCKSQINHSSYSNLNWFYLASLIVLIKTKFFFFVITIDYSIKLLRCFSFALKLI